MIEKKGIDILLTKDMVKEIDTAVRRLEKKTQSCESSNIIIDFETTHEFIKKAGPMVAEMRLKDPENKEILDIARNLASIDNRYSDARYDFENKCICIHTDRMGSELKKVLSKYKYIQ